MIYIIYTFQDPSLAAKGGAWLATCVPCALRKKGTWAYMAPEIFEDVITPKIDIWALGVVP